MAEELFDDWDSNKFMIIANRNITKLFWKQIAYDIKNGTSVVIGANGHTTDGKSTVGCEVIRTVNEEMLGRTMSNKYIFANQQEYTDWIVDNPNEMHLMVQIDEWSDLASSGTNSSIESNFLAELSNVHAQKYIHRFTCSPKRIIDDNTVIQLEVTSKNQIEKTTQCYVYYNLFRAGVTHQQIIGHINLDVSMT